MKTWKDATGPPRTPQDSAGPRRTPQDATGPCRTPQDPTGARRMPQDPAGRCSSASAPPTFGPELFRPSCRCSSEVHVVGGAIWQFLWVSWFFCSEPDQPMKTDILICWKPNKLLKPLIWKVCTLQLSLPADEQINSLPVRWTYVIWGVGRIGDAYRK